MRRRQHPFAAAWFAAAALAGLLVSAGAALAASGEVSFHQKISQTAGGFQGSLVDSDYFGWSVVSVGDLDGNGAADLAVGAPGDGQGSDEVGAGAVWIVFLRRDGSVLAQRRVSEGAGGFTGVLDDGDGFGYGVAAVGDLDGDGVPDLAVGAAGDDDGDTDSGAVWILFLNADGTVKAHQKISETVGGFSGSLDVGDAFGSSLAALGSLTVGDYPALAVGAPADNTGGDDSGAVWIVFLFPDGTVEDETKIADNEGYFFGSLDDFDRFGASLAALGDLDGDTTPDLAVGAPGDDDGGPNRGAVWILLLHDTDGTVEDYPKISDAEGGFAGALDNGDQFGASLASLGDLDCDGVTELAVGAPFDDDGGTDRGAIWNLFLDADAPGTVLSHAKVSDTSGGFAGTLDNGDYFGRGLAALGDLDGDNNRDLAAGAAFDDDGGPDRGAVWLLFLDGNECSLVFADGFESGDASAWSFVVP